MQNDVPGPGNGIVDTFDFNGKFLARVASNGTLNSPWGLALANFGTFGNDLLVGNFGDGRINVFDPNNDAFLGQLNDATGSPITIHGLWGLIPGNGTNAGTTDKLYFTAGPGHEQHGLFGSLRVETPAERFVAQVYQDLLHRGVDAAGLAFWSGQLSTGTSHEQMVLRLEGSSEYRAVVVQGLYTKFLHRSADPGGLAAFTNSLGNGGTVEQLESIITGSQEYFQTRGGNTADGFLDALYTDGLGRHVDAGGRATFEMALANGASPTQIAGAIFTSGEFRQDLVQGFYQTFLHRAADAGGLAFFTNSLQQGMADEKIIASLVGSSEYSSHV
jgi:hypothetical protein